MSSLPISDHTPPAGDPGRAGEESRGPLVAEREHEKGEDG
jgi:hypothetical protein